MTLLVLKIFAKKNFLILTILLSVPTLLYIQEFRWGKWNQKSSWTETINSDGAGYYEYLRALFIYKDFTYTYAIENRELTQSKRLTDFYLGEVENGRVNRYFAGTALLVSPFFLTVYSIEKIIGNDVNGYELPFQIATSFAALLYLLLGLFWLRKLLLLFQVDDLTIFIVSIGYVFGSNIYFYLTMSPMMSHTFSFSILIGFMLFIKKYTISKNPLNIYLSALLLGLALLIRPTNVMIVLVVPFITESWQKFKETIMEIFKKPLILINSALVVSLLVSLQMIFYYIQTGHFIVWSYQGFYFDFLKPHVKEVLFSYNKGNFIYIPLTLLSVISLLFFIRKNFFLFLTGSLFFLVIVYVFSCYNIWNNGASYGIRFLIDFYGVLIIFLALFLANIKNRKKIYFPFVILVLLCIVYNQIQTDQYNKYIIHHFRMNKQRFWEVFLKTAPRYKGIFYVPEFNPDRVKETFTFSFTFDDDASYNNFEKLQIDSMEGYHSKLTRITHDYSGFKYKLKLADYYTATDEVFLHVKFDVYQFNKKNNARIYMCVKNDSTNYSWDNKIIRNFVKGKRKWEQFSYYKYMPKLSSKDDFLHIFFKNNGNEIYIDNLELSILVMNKN